MVYHHIFINFRLFESETENHELNLFGILGNIQQFKLVICSVFYHFDCTFQLLNSISICFAVSVIMYLMQCASLSSSSSHTQTHLATCLTADPSNIVLTCTNGSIQCDSTDFVSTYLRIFRKKGTHEPNKYCVFLKGYLVCTKQFYSRLK